MKQNETDNTLCRICQVTKALAVSDLCRGCLMAQVLARYRYQPPPLGDLQIKPKAQQ